MVEYDYETADFEDCHGLVLEIPVGTEKGAKEIAGSLSNEKICSKGVERIYNPKDNIWIFVWPKNVSVDMPSIIRLASRFPYWRVDTLHNYLKNNKRTT